MTSTSNVTLVTNASGNSEAAVTPTYAVIDVSLALLEKMDSMQRILVEHGFSEIRTVWGPEWGPLGIADELRLQLGELVVTSQDFWFTDSTRDGDTIETPATRICDFRTAFGTNKPGTIVYLTDSEHSRQDFLDDHPNVPRPDAQ